MSELDSAATRSDERAATSRGNPAVSRQFRRNLAIRGLGWAVATALITFEFHLIQTGRSPQFGHLFAIMALGGFAITWSAWAESVSNPSGHGQPWQRGLAWGLAFVVAVMVFWYWIPLGDRLASLWVSSPSVNVVHLPTPFDPPPAPYSVVTDTRSETSVETSPFQVRFYASLLVFGLVGGAASAAARSARTWYALLGVAASSFVWGMATMLGGVCLFIGFYIFAGMLGALFKPAAIVGAELGSAIAGFLSGAAAGALGLPIEIGIAERTRR